MQSGGRSTLRNTTPRIHRCMRAALERSELAVAGAQPVFGKPSAMQ